MSSITGYPSGRLAAPHASPGHYADISGLLLEEAVSTEENHMTQSQSRSTSPASWQPARRSGKACGSSHASATSSTTSPTARPARLALIAFAVVILVFTALLSLPVASATGQATPLHEALFTAVSAVCVTGLTVVSTAVHWSFFGQLVILVGIFVGGLGTLTLASLLALMVSKRLGVRGKLIAQEAMNNAGRLGEVGTLLRIVITTSVVIEGALALALIPRFLILGESLLAVRLARRLLLDLVLQQRRFHPAFGRHRPLRDRPLDPGPAHARRVPRQPGLPRGHGAAAERAATGRNGTCTPS